MASHVGQAGAVVASLLEARGEKPIDDTDARFRPVAGPVVYPGISSGIQGVGVQGDEQPDPLIGRVVTESVEAREQQGGLAGRAKWELQQDRNRKFGGYVFGAFIPATGEALTATYTSRSIVTFLDFLEKVEAWVPQSVGTVYAIMDNLRAHKAYNVLFFSLAHPRWEFVFQPKYAAYLNLIEPWWKTLRSLATKGRFFESWGQIEEAIAKALDYWNEHRHPYVWGRRRRHRTARKPGVGSMLTIPAVEV